jgi:hypothetical protein
MKRINATLRVHGRNLDPDDVTRLLGIQPKKCWRRGDRPTLQSSVPAKFGMWQFDVGEQAPRCFEDVAWRLLESLPSDLSRWHQLAARYHTDLWCGLYLDGWNDMFSVEDKLVQALADRRLATVFDVYESEDAEDEENTT